MSFWTFFSVDSLIKKQYSCQTYENFWNEIHELTQNSLCEPIRLGGESTCHTFCYSLSLCLTLFDLLLVFMLCFWVSRMLCGRVLHQLIRILSNNRWTEQILALIPALDIWNDHVLILSLVLLHRIFQSILRFILSHSFIA